MEPFDWQEFHRSTVIAPKPSEPVPKPHPSELKLFRTRTGLQLPRSYERFISLFGPGEFPGVLRIAGPGYPYLDYRYDLIHANRTSVFASHELRNSGLPIDQQERIQRMFFFGVELGHLRLGWDLTDVRDPEASEYGIYRVGLMQDGATFVASSFRELIEVILGEIRERVFKPAMWIPSRK